MKALDTNVLIRFLVRDEDRQSTAVYRRFKEAETNKGSFFLPILVVLEIIWVLEAVYRVARQDILNLNPGKTTVVKGSA